MSETGGNHELTLMLRAVERGDANAEARLFRTVYDQLRIMARSRRRAEFEPPSVHTTSMVHEAYLRLVGPNNGSWENRRHFFGAAARAMRRILIDHARKRNAVRRGNGQAPVELPLNLATPPPSLDLLALDEALDKLSERHARKARVVEYRYFLGLTVPETAKLLDISPRTVDGDWDFARAWLKRAMTLPAG